MVRLNSSQNKLPRGLYTMINVALILLLHLVFVASEGVVQDINNVEFEQIVNETKIVSPCTASLDKFAEQASLFLRCALSFARPVMFCETCVKEYLHFTTVYDFIIQLDEVTDGKKCCDALLRSDRIQIVVKTYNFITNIWKQSYCDQCFSYYKEKNGTVKYEVSNSTKAFLDLYNTTMDCMLKFAKLPSDFEVDELEFETLSNSSKYNQSACSHCASHYKHLNRMFDALSDDDALTDTSDVCMDIVDAMNYTRQMWGKRFGCVRPRHDYFYVLVTTLFVAFLPIVFYVSSKLHSDAQEMNIRQQSRLDVSSSANFNPDTLASSGVRGVRGVPVASSSSDTLSPSTTPTPIDNTVPTSDTSSTATS